ncbi:MAG: epoxyqueuosine reductase [Clostridia bacterium]|nr:epoxyqueuosine reductase [Clostridia bacterium]
MSKSSEIKEYLLAEGASLIGFADLSAHHHLEMVSGVSIMVKIPPAVIRSISHGPTMNYYDAYHNLNRKLNELAEEGASLIQSFGYKAVAQTTEYVKEFDDHRTKMPHKTVATSAGLGWIGKSALFVTREFGSAIRLTSILTDMTLDYGVPVTESACGDYDLCKKACPGQAVTGKLWRADLDRNEFFDPLKCRQAARALAKEKLNKDITLCGKCIEACPYTKAYVINEENIGN